VWFRCRLNPTAGINCGTWGDCVIGQTSANEYYVGYVGDGSGNCIETDWQDASSTWDVTADYLIDTTEKVDTCSETPIPTISSVDVTPDTAYTTQH